MKAYLKDILRAIRKGKRRFLSLVLITALGVTTMTGLSASCEDLRYSADTFFDKQGLFDIQVVSTLGLTSEDVDIISNIDGIVKAEGIYSEQVYLEAEGQSVDMTVLSEKGINIPYIVEGRLPSKANEVAVIEKYAINTGKGIGDIIEIEEEQDEDKNSLEKEEDFNFTNKLYKITGIVIDVRDVNKAEGSTAFRTPSSSDYTFFVTKEAAKADIFTSIYMKVEGADELQTYSDKYEDKVKSVISAIESRIKMEREKARYDEIISEANRSITDAQEDMDKEFSKADREFSDAWKDINESKSLIAANKKELDENEKLANSRFASAWDDINNSYKEIASEQSKIEHSENQLLSGEQELLKVEADLKLKEKQTIELLDSYESKINANKTQAEMENESLASKVDEIAAMFESGWRNSQWQAFIQAIRNAYIPVISYEVKISQLEEKLNGVDSSLNEYYEIQHELTKAKADKQIAQDKARELIEGTKNEFEAWFMPVLSSQIATIDSQLGALDVDAPDYYSKLIMLQQQKAQMNQLDIQLFQIADSMGKLQATETILISQLDEITAQRLQADKNFSSGYEEINIKKSELEDAKKKLENGKKDIEAGLIKLSSGVESIKKEEQSATAQIYDGRKKLEEAIKQIADGEATLRNKEIEYLEEKAKAEQDLTQAKKELEDIDTPQWYIQDRSSLGGYNNIDTDSSSIEALGKAFPIIFLIVAILISLTTITRKVEEERGLIGIYKALGFTNNEIRCKYTVFALAASLIGGVLGDFFGFVLLPKIVFSIFNTMYSLPAFLIKFDFFLGLAGLLLFTISILGAAFFSCENELRQMPSVLMRPKAPKAGSRVILEYIPFVWNRLSFLNKVTSRNLFRYKKRLFMTIMGTMGCTALLICGFAIKDSVTELLPSQYEKVYRYDLQASSTDEQNDVLIDGLDKDHNIEKFINLRMETVKVKNTSDKENSVRIIVLPKDVSYDSFIYLENLHGDKVELSNTGVYLTENAAIILGIGIGDSIKIQDMGMSEGETVVNDIVKNYLGNNVYMSQQAYENIFGEYKPNSVLINFVDGFLDHDGYADSLGEKEGIVSSISKASLKRDFEKSFSLVNVAVYIIIALAAGLAVVVLFTLSTTNISERERELATIKVLGFYNREVHSYVNKETYILTLLGILLGLPVGQYLGGLLTSVLKMPAVHFAVTIYPISYIYTIVIAFVFAVIVSVVTNGILNRIDPVEALKSVE